MIFRWSMWGECKTENIELLKYSVLTFKQFFGDRHKYVVCTDNSRVLKEKIGGVVKIIEFNDDGGESMYNVNSKATWRKWCPKVKLELDETEIYVDSDVFLLQYPEEIEEIINNSKIKFAIMDEFLGQSWQHGAMQRKASKNTPFVNAGLFIQKAGYSISSELEKEFNWWKENISETEQTHHDEQGSLAIALTPYRLRGELVILPKDKYMLIGPNENTDVVSLEKVTMFHAVYPNHPAFYKFKKHLDKILGLF